LTMSACLNGCGHAVRPRSYRCMNDTCVAWGAGTLTNSTCTATCGTKCLPPYGRMCDPDPEYGCNPCCKSYLRGTDCERCVEQECGDA
jgi:hypothetical protein